MDKDNKKKVPPVINEELMMSMMVDGVKKDGLQLSANPVADEPEESKVEAQPSAAFRNKSAPREKARAKKILDGSYGEHFLKSHSMVKRGDKSIYIRQEYHERLSRIVQVIGKDEIPLYAYLDNILEHHFELFEREITEDFNDKFKPIF